jgi:protein phosphatase
MRTTFAALTDVGLVRQNNEDNFVVFDVAAQRKYSPPPVSSEGSVETDGTGLLIAVADGMGGALAGEVASSMAIETLCEAAEHIDATVSEDDARKAICESIGRANEKIYDASQTNPDQRGMGTTLTAALIRHGRVQFFQVGDSKGYVSRHGKLHQMTNDHSLIGTLVADKVISAEDAEQLEGGRNIILKALGAEPEVNIDVSEAPLEEGQAVLLCTDGLHGCVRETDIERLVGATSDVGKLCDDLVKEAKQHGGPDNITVVGVAVVDGGEAPRTPGLLGRLTGMFKKRDE